MQIRSFVRKAKNEPKGYQIIQFRLTTQEFKHLQIGANLQTGRVSVDLNHVALILRLSDAPNLGMPVKPGFDEEKIRYEQISYRPLAGVNIPLTPWQSVTPTLTKHQNRNVVVVHFTQIKPTFPRFYARKVEPLYHPEEHPPSKVRSVNLAKSSKPQTKTQTTSLPQQLNTLVDLLNTLADQAGVKLTTNPRTGKIELKLK